MTDQPSILALPRDTRGDIIDMAVTLIVDHGYLGARDIADAQIKDAGGVPGDDATTSRLWWMMVRTVIE